jgi:hypothetical protein
VEHPELAVPKALPPPLLPMIVTAALVDGPIG